ncbi:2,5-diamino-6-(ribosylamino)-4(3H)-pyrimidinone 5'-phosphate reductase [Euryarchaeota archaeon ex4484_178]|nr:MAG: 2,5-diamino-6-(ribosylamino)-4(3H)-pyrimidinone 5'-phosphate reductase [Euryarchaeota archaeon ex4484_178]
MRPRVIINAAMSVDGKIALRGGKRIKISDEEDFRRVHELRNSVDAILVGINTVILDNPKLLVKERYVKSPRNPVRVVLDSHLRIPEDARVLDGNAPTIIITTKDARERKLNAEIIKCGKGRVDLKCAMEKLYSLGIRSVLVEGGGTVIYSFLKEKLVDEISVFVGSIIIGGEAPTLAEGLGASSEDELIHLKLLEARALGSGVLLRYGVVYD